MSLNYSVQVLIKQYYKFLLTKNTLVSIPTKLKYFGLKSFSFEISVIKPNDLK